MLPGRVHARLHAQLRGSEPRPDLLVAHLPMRRMPLSLESPPLH
jgi:hypothetical protein